MSITVRRAENKDAAAMTELLNEIIAIGGTTAFTSPVTEDYLITRMAEAPDRSAWHVALDSSGACVGFQWICPAEYLPTEACEIATFAKAGQTGLGIGSKLFEVTRNAAKSCGYKWINANIRSDNESGLAYYSSRVFTDYGRQENVTLANGMTVSKTLKRLDLK